MYNSLSNPSKAVEIGLISSISFWVKTIVTYFKGWSTKHFFNPLILSILLKEASSVNVESKSLFLKAFLNPFKSVSLFPLYNKYLIYWV